MNPEKQNHFKNYLYSILKEYVNLDTKEAYPTLEELKSRSGLSIPTIKKYLNLLQDQSLITITKDKGYNGNNYSRFIYKIL